MSASQILPAHSAIHAAILQQKAQQLMLVTRMHGRTCLQLDMHNSRGRKHNGHPSKPSRTASLELRQNFVSVFRDHDRVLVLRRPTAVRGDDRPAVLPLFRPRAAVAENWLDRERLPWLHGAALTIPRRVHHRRRVEAAADAVADEVRHNRQLVLLRERLNRLQPAFPLSQLACSLLEL